MITETTIDWLMWQKSHWQAWLEEQIKQRKQVFLTDPDEMSSAYNRERESARDYHGRELLELLQNADDAGAEQNHSNRVYIELEDEALYVANSGQPFSPAGIKSLMVSNNSPKQLSRTRVIGYKGLGFRSILGWASKIAILSADLEIGFAEEEAIKTGKELYSHNDGIKKVADSFLARTKTFPIATLSCPFWLDINSIAEKRFSTMIRRCKELTNEGFDTCIGFVLSNPQNTREKVLSQILALGKELLIFSNYLERVDLRTRETNVTWYAEREDKKVIVASETEEPSLWEVFSKSDQIPLEYIGPGQPQDMLYEIKVAVPDNGIGQDRVFVYFPTQVSFPFPVVAHATFELVGNRQHLIDSEINRFLCNELASVMADAAEKSIDPDRPWRGLSIVTPTSAIDKVLAAMNFGEKLIGKCSDKRIIPVRGTEFIDAKNAKSIDGNFDEFLKGENFSNLCLWTDDFDIEIQLQKLDVESISQIELKERINKITSTLSLEMRAKLIYTLVDNSIFNEDSAPALLIDGRNNVIPDSISPFLPPEGRTFSLPDWVPTRFINANLVTILQEEFGVSRVRDLATKLKVYKVQEYNFATIVQTIVAEANRRVQASPENELQIRREMLVAILDLYETRTGEETSSLSQRITFIVPTRTGEFQSANNLYFGKEYDRGQLMETLLGSIEPGLFVADPDMLGLSSGSANLEPFLQWLGVTDLLRLRQRSYLSNRNYLDSVLSSLKYPAKFEDFNFSSSDEIKSNSPRIRHVQNFDNLENILESADPVAIITWLSLDSRIEKLRSEGDKEATVSVHPPRTQYYRNLQGNIIPSYAIWLLGNTEWLPTLSGRKSPVRCTLARGLPGELSRIIGMPNIDPEAPLFKKVGIDRTAITRALLTIGVSSDIHNLSWETFYQILLELPTIDLEGKHARSLYRVFVGRDDQGVSEGGKTKDKFFQDGKMFGKLGEKYKYFPITELYYIDNFALLSHIEAFFPLLELDKRRGGGKVRRLFNVKPMTAEEIGARLRVKHHELHPGADALQHDIERMKPFIYALRFDDDADRSELSPLKKLEIKLCKSVTAEIRLDDRIEQIVLNQGESLKEGNTTYLVAEPIEYDRSFLSDPIIADAIGEVVSSVLRVDLSSDIARLISCRARQRRALLDRILGGASEDKLIESGKLLSSPLEEIDEFSYTPPLPTEPPPFPVPSPETAEPRQVGPTDTESEIPPSTVGPITLTPEEFTPAKGGSKTKIKIIRSRNPKPHKRRVLTNPDRTENLAIEFEKAQSRFPLKVSDIKGVEAYGCDILSFKNEHDRDIFSVSPELSLIMRFIEVKGSGLVRGSITLKGNELKAAQNFPDRYYLYRVYEDEDERGTFELIELANPLDLDEESLEIEYEVHPFRTDTAQLWIVTEHLDADQEKY
jgi:hypothetical protein